MLHDVVFGKTSALKYLEKTITLHFLFIFHFLTSQNNKNNKVKKILSHSYFIYIDTQTFIFKVE